MIGNRTRTAIIYAVTAVWVANFGAGFFVEDYHPDQAINGIFLAIVGGLFALGKKDDGDGSGSAPGRHRGVGP